VSERPIVTIGIHSWEKYPEYGWVYVNEDDPVMLGEEVMLDRITELEAAIKTYVKRENYAGTNTVYPDWDSRLATEGDTNE